jgi:cytochrome c oxidase subunit 2
VTADLDYLRRSILDTAEEVVQGYSAVMSTYRGQINEEELVQLLQYVRSLTRGGADDTTTTESEAPTAGEDDR